MNKNFFNNQVCEQLARELVTEQAELLKHETLVKEIKAKLVEGKRQLIKKLIEGKDIYLDGRKRTALLVSFEVEEDRMMVVVTMGLEADHFTVPRNLTKREKELVQDYKFFLDSCKGEFYEDDGVEAIEVADKLAELRNQIRLTYCTAWEIDFCNATTPDFFENSGLEVHRENGDYLLEDLII